MIELVLGGARSGKSQYAQSRALKLTGPVTYIATAQATDREMSDRIARHQADRPAEWTLVEQPLALHQAIRRYGTQCNTILLIDCLTLWLNNEIYNGVTTSFESLTNELTASLVDAKSDVILVSNEVGMGIVPIGEVTRQFVDWQGWLNQAVAKCADRVTFVAAGLPLHLKGDNDE